MPPPLPVFIQSYLKNHIMDSTSTADAKQERYIVVINHEEQYSIWPEYRELPLGWFDAGKHGSKEECLAHIAEVWTDMRPLSLRKHMGA